MTRPFHSAEAEFGRLHQLSDHLYSYLTHFMFNGTVPLHNRSVVVHLPAGANIAAALVITNPAELNPSLTADLKALEQRSGAQVRYLISPSDWHFLFIGTYLSEFPSATAYIPPGRIPAKHPDYPFTLIDVSIDNPFPELSPHLELFNFRDMLDVEDATRTKPRHELAFYHPESQAFTAADIFQYQRVDTPWPLRWFEEPTVRCPLVPLIFSEDHPRRFRGGEVARAYRRLAGRELHLSAWRFGQYDRWQSL
jgi:hypothetical protein